MISKTFDWLRTTEVQPSNENVATRNSVVTSILETLDGDKELSSLVSLVSAACGGLTPGTPADEEYGKELVEVTREHQPAVSENLAENALDLRITCLIALGEFITRKPVKGIWWQARALAGSLFLAGVGVRESEGSHLDSIRVEISGEASGVIRTQADKVRTRKQVDTKELDKVSDPADLVTFWSELKPVLTACIATLQSSSNADRDELEILWWLYGRYSESHSQPIQKLTPFEAAVATASELVDRSLVPAHPALEAMVVGATIDGRKKASLNPKELSTIVSKWAEAHYSLLIPRTEIVTGLLKDFPKVMPISWLAVKCSESGVNKGWEAEFEMKSSLDAKLSLSPEQLASQAFTERAAQRLLATFA